MKTSKALGLLLYCFATIPFVLQAAIFLPIHPEENETVLSEDFFAVFTLREGNFTSENKKWVKGFFDNQEITAKLVFSENTVRFLPDATFKAGLKADGLHKIKMVSYDSLGKILDEKSISVNIRIPVTSRKKAGAARWQHHGRWMTTGRMETVQDSQLTLGELQGSGSGQSRKFYYQYLLSLTNDENDRAQTRQRGNITVGYGPALKLSLGDQAPVLHPYILNGQQNLRGLELRLSGAEQGLQLSFVYGQTRRPINSYITNPQVLADSVVAAQNAGRPFSHDDSLFYYSGGTYARRLWAGRLQLGSGQMFKFGLTVSSVRDDSNSINSLYRMDSLGNRAIYGQTPKDNFIAGFDFLVAFYKRQVQIFLNTALSAWTDNILPGSLTQTEMKDLAGGKELPINLENNANIFIVNTSTKPLPSIGGIKNAIAADAGIRFDLPIKTIRQKLELKYLLLGANYRSFGYEFLAVNQQGIQLSEALILFKNRLALNANLSLLHDNLDGSKPEPTQTVNWGLNLIVFWDPAYPSLTLIYQNNDQTNNSEISSNLNQQTQSDLVGLTTSFQREIGFTKNQLNVNLVKNGFDYQLFTQRDTILDTVQINSETNVLNLTLQTRFISFPLITSLGYQQTLADGFTQNKFRGPVVGITIPLFSNQLVVKGEGRWQLTEQSGGGPTSWTSYYLGEADYQFFKKHQIVFAGQYTAEEIFRNKKVSLRYQFRY